MFRIGEFARLSRVSVKMLRHYDSIGLLKPAAVDPLTDYRYYTADQLPRLNRILALKDLGFSMDQIAQVLNDNLPAGEIRGMLKLKRAEIAQRLLDDETRLARVEARLHEIEHEQDVSSYDVIVRPVQAQLVASLRKTLGPDDDTEPLFDEVESYVARYRARAALPPMTIHHNDPANQSHFDLEIAIPIIGPMPASGGISVRELSGSPAMACLIHTGNYTNLDSASSALHTWINRNGYKLNGPFRTVYLRFGVGNVDFVLPPAFLTREASAFVTELQVPVAIA